MSGEFHKAQHCGWPVNHNLENDPIRQLAKWAWFIVDIYPLDWQIFFVITTPVITLNA